MTVALLAAVLVAGCKKQQQQAAPQRPPAPVVVAAAVTQDVPVYLDEVGRTAARESVVIQPQVGGKILDVHFADGSDVKKGQLLFTIDPRPFQAKVAQAEAELAENRADAKYAEDELKRVAGIRESGAISTQEYEQKTSALTVAQAKVKAGEAAVEIARLDLDYCTIKSPIDGRVGQRLVDPGNVVSGGGPEGGTKLLVVQNLDPIYADFTVTENEFGTVRKFMAEGRLPGGDPQGKLKVLVEVPADARRVTDAVGTAATQPATQPVGPREGVLTFLDNRVQEGSGTVKLRATVPNQDRYFWPGQFVRVRLVLTTKKDAPLIPEMAQQVGQQGPYVYVVKPDMTAEIRNIVVGQRQGDMIVVNQGVLAGEQVIVQGHMAVMPGAKVNILPTPGQHPAPHGQPAPQGQPAPATKPADGGAVAEGAKRS
jgi:multidrug efflux system membrane fusion protein